MEESPSRRAAMPALRWPVCSTILAPMVIMRSISPTDLRETTGGQRPAIPGTLRVSRLIIRVPRNLRVAVAQPSRSAACGTYRLRLRVFDLFFESRERVFAHDRDLAL